MSNVIEMEAFRLKRELLNRQGKSIANKIIAAHMIDNAKAVINPSGLMFDRVWLDESREIAHRQYEAIAARQNEEIEVERQKHKELTDD